MALLIKWVRRLMQPPSDQVTAVLHDSYGRGMDWEQWATPLRGDSAFIRGLRGVFAKAQPLFRPKLGDGTSLRFWLDDWTGLGPLRDLFPRLSGLSPAPRTPGSPADRSLIPRSRILWRRRIPLKVKIFGWLLLRRRLVTRQFRQRWYPGNTAECVLCSGAVEDCGHLFFRCPTAQAVWQAAGVGSVDPATEEDFWNSISGGLFRQEPEWQRIFAHLWAIWLHRNEVIFKGRPPSVDAILHDARGLANFWKRGGCGPLVSSPL
ncbi:uncharacterized protein LOC144713124 [Wolffia australiana]